MNDVNGHTAVCGLIGNPVGHTLSPLIHNAIAGQMGEALAYVPFPVEEGGLEAAIRGAYALGVRGLNITVPYKSAVLPFLEAVDPAAARIGAVNTLIRGTSGFVGYNTDAEGLSRAIEETGIAIEGETVLLLGAGGAARAAAFMCADRRADSVVLLNRSVGRAERLAAEVNHSVGIQLVSACALSDYEGLFGSSENGQAPKKYLAIQCTSVGLYPDTEQAVISAPSFYEHLHTGYDLIYRPACTRFMSLTGQYGGTAYNGLKMLLYQAIAAYEKWTHVVVPAETVETVYESLQKCVECKNG